MEGMTRVNLPEGGTLLMTPPGSSPIEFTSDNGVLMLQTTSPDGGASIQAQEFTMQLNVSADAVVPEQTPLQIRPLVQWLINQSQAAAAPSTVPVP